MSTPYLLPETWLNRIWSTMRATYGAEFDRQWECPAGVEPTAHVMDLRIHWARELSRFAENPSAIGFALENLPEHPPNLRQFLSLCNRRPDPPLMSLAPPVVKRTERSAEAVASLQVLREKLLRRAGERMAAPKSKPVEVIEPDSKEDAKRTAELKRISAEKFAAFQFQLQRQEVAE